MPGSPVRIVTITIPHRSDVPASVRDFIKQTYYHAEPQAGVFAIGSEQSDDEIRSALLVHVPPSASVSIHSVRGVESQADQAEIGFVPDFRLEPPNKRK